MSLDYYTNDNEQRDWGYQLFKWAIILGSAALVLGFGWFVYKDLTGPAQACQCVCTGSKNLNE